MKFILFALGALSATAMFFSRASASVDYDALRLRELVDELTQRYPDYLSDVADSNEHAARDVVEPEVPRGLGDKLLGKPLTATINCGTTPKLESVSIKITLGSTGLQALQSATDAGLFRQCDPPVNPEAHSMDLYFGKDKCNIKHALTDCKIIKKSVIEFRVPGAADPSAAASDASAAATAPAAATTPADDDTSSE